MRIDKRLFAGGIAMLVIGVILSAHISSLVPAGTSQMTEEQIEELFLRQQENQDMGTLAAILSGAGFLLVLISFGARRKRKSGSKQVEKKPDVGM